MFLKQILLPTPSVSGIEILGENVYLIGDNNAYLHRYDKDGNYKDKFLLFDQFESHEIIEKKVKPDLEMMSHVNLLGEDYLYLCGSGSYKTIRDTLVVIHLDDNQLPLKDSVQLFSLTPLYDRMRIIVEALGESLNLEGLTADKSSLYFFHRGNVCGKNVIFKVNKNQFFYFLQDGLNLPNFEFFKINLPGIEGYNAGFSDAKYNEETQSIIFCASVEGTKNAFDDGTVFGSYVGEIPISELKHDFQPRVHLLQHNQTTQRVKVEGISVKSFEKDQSHLILVTDPDGAASEWIELMVQF